MNVGYCCYDIGSRILAVKRVTVLKIPKVPGTFVRGKTTITAVVTACFDKLKGFRSEICKAHHERNVPISSSLIYKNSKCLLRSVYVLSFTRLNSSYAFLLLQVLINKYVPDSSLDL